VSAPSSPAPSPSSRWITAVLLALTVIAAGALRLANLDWDRGAHLHPDERYLALVSDEISAPPGPAAYFDTARSPLNPANHDESFVYGTAPLFLTKGVATWLHAGAVQGDQPAHAVVAGLDRLGVDLLDARGAPRFDGGYGDVLVGRLLSALLDTLTTLAVFELARLAGGRRAGLAAAAVWATCVLAIQHAHFFVVEPMLVLATALALVAAAHAVRRDARGWLALGGVAAGLAGASKVSGLAVGAVVLAAAAVHRAPALAGAWRTGRGPGPGPGRGEGDRRAAARAVAGAPAGRAVAVDVLVVAGLALLVFRILQPYAFAGWFGFDPRWLDALRELARMQDGGDVPPNVQWAARVPVLEPLGHLVRFGFGVPATVLALVGVAGLRRWRGWRSQPVVALLAGWAVLGGALALPRFVPAMRYLLPIYPALAALAGCGAARLLAHHRPAARRVGAALVAGAGLWALAFVHGVPSAEHPRLAASEWLVEHAPAGATLSFQEWDDGLPVSSPAAAAKGFRRESLHPFAVETADDVRSLAAALGRIDYVVESSERVTGTVGRVPARYAPVLRYYRGLADGSLGFVPVATFSNRPSLFGLELDDTGSEEAFRIYDHPTVRIWRKTSGFSLERALAVLQPDRTAASVHVPLGEAAANGLLLRERSVGTGVVGGDAGRAAEALGLDDHGPTFDRAFPGGPPGAWPWWLAWWEVTALAALPWVTRLFRSLPDRGLGLAKVLGPLAVVVPLWAAVAWGVVRFSGTTAWLATAAALAAGLASPRWRRDALAFLRHQRRALLTVEALTLGVFGAVLLLRAANPDLWFHPTGGEKPFDTAFFTAVARSSTVPPADPWYSGGAMNYYYGGWFGLAVPTRALGLRPEVVLNLAVATVASLVAAVSWTVGVALAGLRRTVRPAGRTAGIPSGAGLLAAGAVLLAGNLDTVRQQAVRGTEALAGRPVVAFDWWSTSRLHAGTTDINEFPAWSVLFGDPHPHLLSLPALLATVAVLCTYVVTRRDGAKARALGLAGVAGAGLAWTRVGHTWDLPTLALLALGAVVTGSLLDPDRAAGRAARWRTGAVDLAVLAVTAVVLPWPYARSTQVFDRGFTESASRTPVGALLLQLGVPLGLAVGFLAWRTAVALRAGTGPFVLRRRAGRLGTLAAGAGLVLVVAGVSGWAVALGAVVVGGVLVSAVHDLRHGELGRGLAAGLLAAGAGLAVLPDLATVVNDIGRQNTVFKFGFTAWVLLALGASALAVDLTRLDPTRIDPARFRRVAQGGLAVVAAATLAFWPSAAPARLQARFEARPLGLDGRAWLHRGPVAVEAGGMPPVDVTADEPLVAWLRAHGRGGQSIVEAVGPSYSWVGRVSVATGLPTVVGWGFHEQQQRRGYAATVTARTAAVTALYTQPDATTALRVLAAYQPDYVVVGTVERVLGTPAALDGLGDLPGLSVAFRHGRSVIYRVEHATVARELARIDAADIRAAARATAPAEPMPA
jgi:YYY domain-containing protein